MSEVELTLPLVKARKKTRKILFQKLYAQIFSVVDSDSFFEAFFEDVFDFDLDTVYLDEMFGLVIQHQEELLYIISLLAPKFKLESMNIAYVLPVCIGACEMLYYPEEIPAKVSINEAIELAKIYGDESSKKIVNGMMNKLYKDFDAYKQELATHVCTGEVQFFCR